MNGELVKNVIEAALLVAEKPLTLERLLELFDPAEQEALAQAIEAALLQLETDYQGRGIELKKVASGYRIQARAEVAPWVNRLWDEKPARYSRAFMETLAIIAYRQPITRGEIEEIRGVGVSSHIIKTLMDREWLRVAGHRDVPGRPAVYVTTPQFLDYFNLGSLADLPVLAELGTLDSITTDSDGLAEEDAAMLETDDAGSHAVQAEDAGADSNVTLPVDQAVLPDASQTEETVALTVVSTPTSPATMDLNALDDLSDDQVAEQIALAEAAAEEVADDAMDEVLDAASPAQACGSS